MGKSDLISIIYANIQNLISNFVAPCPHIIIIHAKFHQNQTSAITEETI